jgi:hypothetical protein
MKMTYSTAYPMNAKKEIREAVYAGEQALICLDEAKKKLSSAGNWGLVDLLGGDFFSGLMKHSRMSEAEECLERARDAMQVFRRELNDVYLPADIHIETSDFLSFADFFFDGFLADYLVQSRINKTRKQINEAIIKIGEILVTLKKMEHS